jgi:phenol 2-monooxygenase
VWDKTITFVSGIGVQYSPSILSDSAHVSSVSTVKIGVRMSPEDIIRAADGRPFNLHDLLPADTRFKLLVFGGEFNDPKVRAALQKAADAIQHLLPSAFGGHGEKAVDTITIMKADLFENDFTDVPTYLRPHWSKYAFDSIQNVEFMLIDMHRVFYDSLAADRITAGKAYNTYGIGPEGAIIVVRPDCFVGTILPISEASKLAEYFAQWAPVA